VSGMKVGLSETSKAVLHLIATGHDYAQILARLRGVTYVDIFFAAQEALTLEELGGEEWMKRLTKIKAKHPNAYTSWTAQADEELLRLFAEGRSNQELAIHFGRQPSAIRSRLRKLEGAAALLGSDDHVSKG
jgi:DNA-binding CsgD family transcriptional regulator